MNACRPIVIEEGTETVRLHPFLFFSIPTFKSWDFVADRLNRKGNAPAGRNEGIGVALSLKKLISAPFELSQEEVSLLDLIFDYGNRA
jgi:hypothetical protein